MKAVGLLETSLRDYFTKQRHFTLWRWFCYQPSNENSLGHSVRSVQPPFQGVSGVKRPEIEADHSPVHLAPRWSHTYTSPCLHGVQSDSPAYQFDTFHCVFNVG